METAPFPLAETFFLHSFPGATKTIYLDFTGHLTQNTQWNTDFALPTILTPAFSLDSDVANFSAAEQFLIQSIWERVTEDFRPFQVNVTTQDPGIEALRNTGNGDQEWGQRVVIGGDSTFDWFTPNDPDGRIVGGVAYGSFNWDSDTPTFVFGGGFGASAHNLTEVISHETGHTLGLAHDGQKRFYLDISKDPAEYVSVYIEYYAGHGSGPTAWAPIMGNSYGGSLTQWSRGEYFNATNNEAGTGPQQDDLAIITTQNGFDYRPDDHGSSVLDASVLDLDAAATLFSAEGIIERNTDVDYFSFDVFGLGELVSFDIDPFQNGPNLDVLATIYDSSDVALYRTNPIDAIRAGSQTFGGIDGGWAQLDASGNVLGYVSDVALLAGTYYLAIEGAGRPITFIDPAVHPGPIQIMDIEETPLPPDLSDWGYTDYGSLGYYSITGNRKKELVVGVDFDVAGGAKPLNWTLYSGTESLNNLTSEAGFATPYDLTVSSTGATIAAVTTANPIDSANLPNHSLPLGALNGYIPAAGETLTFVWSDLDPSTVYQVYVFGHADISVTNDVTVTGGQWNGVTQTYNFTQTISPNGMAVNGDNQPGGEDLTTLGLLVISNELGQIEIEVTNAVGSVAGVAGLAISTTKLGSLSGQKWNDLNGDGGGTADPGEQGLPGWMIYLDLNNNEELDVISTPDGTFTQSAPNVPQVIADYNIVKNELIFDTSGEIADVNVTLDVAHTFNGDLNIYLISPAGTRVKLVADRGGNSDNFTNTEFDDSAAVAIASVTPAMAPFTGTFRPEEPLSAFIGEDSGGKWTLEISDDGPGDTGNLLGWSLEVTVAGTTTFLEPFQVTDAAGNYSFTALKPGLYYVREHIQEQQLIDGWRQSWAAPPVLVTSGAAVTGVDFGNWIPIFSPGSITGQKWLDANGNGDLEPGEPGLEGWIVYIDSNNNGVRDVATSPTTIAATDLPKPITDFSTLTSSIMVGNLGAILDVEVTLDITHSFMADLEAYLTSPSGRIVELFTGVGAQFNDFQNVTFADNAARSISTIGQNDVPYTGRWRPEGLLSAFFGDDSTGLWTLTIRDTAFADLGTLNSWSISINVGERFATTDVNGNYSIDDLPPGKYLVREEFQPGWLQTYAPTVLLDGQGNPYNVDVTPGSGAVANFGNKFAVELPGDFNRDGFVDQADYIVYRKTVNMAVATPYDGADGSGNGTVGPEDLAVWQANFGRTLGGGGGGGAESSSESGSGGGEQVLAASSDTAPIEVTTMSAASASAPSSFSNVAGLSEAGLIQSQIASASPTVVAPIDAHVAASSDFGRIYSLMADLPGPLSDSSDTAEQFDSPAETSNDAALVALLNVLDDAAQRLDDELADSSDDAFASFDADDSELSDEAGDELDGIDALFELIGA